MSKNKTIKFFISSTFKDFLKERNALQNFVFPRLKKLCQKEGFSFQPVDLRWGVTSESSDDNQTMNFCLNEVKRCSSEPKPNLLVLLGQRYGWGPLPSEINAIDFENDIESNKLSEEDKDFLRIWYLPDTNSKCYLPDTNITTHIYYLKDKKNVKNWREDETKLKQIFKKAVGNNDKYKDFFKSATELEIRDALDNQFKGNKDNTLVYLRSFSTTDDQDYYENSDEKQKKLNDLKSYLKNDIYSLVEQNNIDLNLYKKSDKDTQKFSALSFDLQYFCIKIFQQYYKNIRREMKKYTKDKPSYLIIEIEEQKKFLEFKSEVVIGRVNEVEEIKSFILNSDEQYYLLYGKSGSGKSSVMAQTIFDLIDNGSKGKLSDEYKVLYRFIGTTAHTSSPRDTFEHIYWELKGEEKKPFIAYEDHKFNTQFRELLKSYDKQIILFIDAVDQFNTYDSLSIFLDELPENVKVIFSTLNKHQQEDNIDTLYYKRLINSISKTDELDVLKNSNEAILKRWLDKAKKELTEEQSKYLLSQCEKQTPLYLRLAFSIAKEWTSGYLDYKNDIQGDEKALIVKFFEKLEKNHYHKNNLIARILGLISASKDGLSESELIDLLSREEDILKNYERENSSYPKLSKLPDAIFSRLYFHMQEFFTEKLIDGEMLITPFHRIIGETIKSKYYKNEAIELHTKLSTYFLTLQDKNKTWNERYNNIHMLSETPYQLFKSEDSIGLKKILFDLEFAGSIYNNYKQDSFREILKKSTELKDITEDEIYPWESFYREKEHLILKVDEELWRPYQSLFQLAYEDGDNSPLTVKVEYLLTYNKIDFHWLKKINREEEYIRTDLLYIFVGHKDSIVGSIQLNNGTILTWSKDTNLRLWNDKAEPLGILEKHAYPIENVKILNDGNIVSWSVLELIIWDSEGKLLKFFDDYSCKNVLELSDGRIVSWSEMGELVVYDKQYNILNNILNSSSHYSLNKVEVFQSGKILLCYDDELILFSENGNKIKYINQFTSRIKKLLIQDESVLCWSSKEVLIWNLDNEINILKEHTSVIEGAKFLSDKRIISWSWNELIIWNIKGKLLCNMDNYNCANTIELSNGKIMTTSDDKRPLNEEGEEIDSSRDVIAFARELDLANIPYWSHNKSVRIWNKKGTVLKDIKYNDYVKSINLLDSGKIITTFYDRGVSVVRDKNYKIFKLLNIDLSNIKPIGENMLLSIHNNYMILWDYNFSLLKVFYGTHVENIIVLKNNNILTYGNDKNLRIFSLESIRKSIKNDSSRINKYLDNIKDKTVSFLMEFKYLDDKRIFTLCDDAYSFRIWDKQGNNILFKGHNNHVQNVKILKNGLLVSYSSDYTVIFWDNNGKPLKILKDHTDSINGMKVLNNGRVLTWSDDYRLILWNENGKSNKILKDHTYKVTGVKILDDNKILSWTSKDYFDKDGCFRLWDQEGNLLKIIEDEEKNHLKDEEVPKPTNNKKQNSFIKKSSDCFELYLTKTNKQTYYYISDNNYIYDFIDNQLVVVEGNHLNFYKIL